MNQIVLLIGAAVMTTMAVISTCFGNASGSAYISGATVLFTMFLAVRFK